MHLIGCEWKGSSVARVHLQISEITLLCAGSMGVGLWGINMDISLDVNGKIKVGGFRLSVHVFTLKKEASCFSASQ